MSFNRSVYKNIIGPPKFNSGIIGVKTGKNITSFSGNSTLVSTPYLYTPANEVFNFREQNFTVEFWIYCIDPWTDMINPGIAGQKSNDNDFGWQIYRNTFFNEMVVRTGGADYYAGGFPETNVWEHWALVRQGTTLSWYRNGRATGTHDIYDNIVSNSGEFYIGYTQTWNGNFKKGYLSNLRIVKGVAVYTGNFTVPTSPLTVTQNAGNNISAITGSQTSLLTLQNSTFIDNSNNKFTLIGSMSPADFNPFQPSVASLADIILIGGGGGGGAPGDGAGGGGGGGGGLVRWTTNPRSSSPEFTKTLNITIGSGGPSNTNGAPTTVFGYNSLGQLATNIYSYGGGAGGRDFSNGPEGRNGGSGGGGGTDGGGACIGGSRITFSNTISNGSLVSAGNDGSLGNNTDTNGAGGGGGLGNAGVYSATSTGGTGGAGILLSTVGDGIYYGAGGGGSDPGKYAVGQGGLGGLGGGGTGGRQGSGQNATGIGAGGGGASNFGVGGTGGPGIVIIVYPSSNGDLKSISAGLTYTGPDIYTRPGYKIYKFTAGSGTVVWY